MNRIIYLVSTIIIFTISVACAAIILGQDGKPTALNKVVSRNGWSIPQYEEKEFVNKALVEIQGTPFIVNKYKLQRTLSMQLDYYLLTPNNTLITNEREVDVRVVRSYLTNDERVFAYELNCVPPGVGTLIIAYFLDEDGDGKFETRYITDRALDVVPAWVKGTIGKRN